MTVSGLIMQHFRCHRQLTLSLVPGLTVVVGNNASGKTSVIEALAVLSTGQSFRAEKDEEMIAFGQELARVKTKVDDDELETVLTRGILQGKAVQRKHYFVNGTRRRKKDFLGHFYTVVFRPEDMRLIEGSPARRRQFLDTVLSVLSAEYAVALTTYENGLKRRNKLIDQVRDGQMPRSVLSYWTQLLLKHGQLLQEQRRQFLQQFTATAFPLHFQIEYLPSLLTEERLAAYSEKELAAGHTLIGPHKDDFMVRFISAQAGEWVDVAHYGSRGQQRLAVLWLKYNELWYLEVQTGQRPLLLLDDILSELDRTHRQQVELLLTAGQAVVTTTEVSVQQDLELRFPDLQVISL